MQRERWGMPAVWRLGTGTRIACVAGSSASVGFQVEVAEEVGPASHDGRAPPPPAEICGSPEGDRPTEGLSSSRLLTRELTMLCNMSSIALHVSMTPISWDRTCPIPDCSLTPRACIHCTWGHGTSACHVQTHGGHPCTCRQVATSHSLIHHKSHLYAVAGA